MKLHKNASGKQIIKINKKEWIAIGKEAGWLSKKASLGKQGEKFNVGHVISFEKINGQWESRDTEMTPEVQQVLLSLIKSSRQNPNKIDTVEIELNLEVSGSYEEKSWDSPGGSYEERYLNGATANLYGIGMKEFTMKVPQEIVNLIENNLHKVIKSLELDYPEGPEPDGIDEDVWKEKMRLNRELH